MKKRLSTIALAAAIAVMSTGAALAQTRSAPIAAAENGRLWFVEMSGAPVADGNSLAAVRNEKAAFRQAARAAGIRITERRSFDTLFNGFSVEVDPRDRAKLLQIPGVKAIYPVAVIQAPNPERTGAGSAADMATALAMTGANIAQNSLGLTGKGIKVGIIDTGIDLDHPDFGGTGIPGSGNLATHPRIKYGYDFVGDAYNADSTSPSYNPVPSPDPNPDDCNGHGTHVAGITGAKGTVKGVAPDVTFGAYRVFGCGGSSTADVIIAAMERALADGMQVVNQSLGAAFQWPQYPTARAADRLVNKGVVMVASIGNSGASGLYTAGAPGVGSKVIGVASYDNTVSTQSAFRIDPGNRLVGFNVAGGSSVPPSSGTAAISVPTIAPGCNVADFAGFPAGNIALVIRGGCTFAVKAANAQAAGASAVVLYNNQPGGLNPTIAGSGVMIPVVGIAQADGLAIAATAGATLTWGGFSVSSAVASGGLISSFSSYGLAADLSLKPDIGAPGGFIYSTYPLESGAFASLSGTSMSAPHVAGAVAQILEANPKINPRTMAARLQNQADPKNWWGNPGLGFLDNVHRQGAGMLDVVGTVQARTLVEPGKLSLGESETGPATRTLTIRNEGSAAVTYTLGHAPALSTSANTFTPGFTTGFAAVAFSAPSVTVPAKGSATVDVTITANAALPDRGIYGGYVTLAPNDGTSTLRVPYAGLKGDYQSFQVLTSGGFGFPALGWSTDGVNFGLAGAGDVFTMAGADIPYVLAHLDHHSRRMRIEAFDAVSGRSWHRVSDDEYLPRNSTATDFFAFAWDGTTFRGNGKNPNQWVTVPNGQYVLKVSVLKALGDESNPAHWETWTSPAFTIARP